MLQPFLSVHLVYMYTKEDLHLFIKFKFKSIQFKCRFRAKSNKELLLVSRPFVKLYIRLQLVNKMVSICTCVVDQHGHAPKHTHTPSLWISLAFYGVFSVIRVKHTENTLCWSRLQLLGPPPWPNPSLNHIMLPIKRFYIICDWGCIQMMSLALFFFCIDYDAEFYKALCTFWIGIERNKSIPQSLLMI